MRLLPAPEGRTVHIANMEYIMASPSIGARAASANGLHLLTK
jgi:hypothetical protein